MSAPSAFAPGSVAAFRFTGLRADWDSGTLELGYALDDIAFTERYAFPLPEAAPTPARRAALDRAARLLHLVAGVSYYKAAAPPRVLVAGDPPSPAAAALARRLYAEGLGEFAWVNDLPRIGAGLDFPSAPAAPAPAAGLAARTLVPLGGGKDSVVSLAALVAGGEPVLALTVGAKEWSAAAARIEGVPLIRVERSLDPALFALNARGALNGHVPITAIVSCVAVVTALLHDCDAIAMSNERSASAGTLDWPAFGGEINHQFSKGWEVESALAAVVRGDVAADLAYFSLLRPWSELAIARAFARLRRHHATTMSCNRGFRIHESAAPGWCADCPKCRFVALVLAPFMPRGELVAMMGADVLDDPAQEAGLREVLGLGADKPFECVGEIDEARAALRAIAADPGWAGATLVARLAPGVGGPDPGAAEPWLAPSGPDGIPARHRALVDAALRA